MLLLLPFFFFSNGKIAHLSYWSVKFRPWDLTVENYRWERKVASFQLKSYLKCSLCKYALVFFWDRCCACSVKNICTSNHEIGIQLVQCKIEQIQCSQCIKLLILDKVHHWKVYSWCQKIFLTVGSLNLRSSLHIILQRLSVGVSKCHSPKFCKINDGLDSVLNLTCNFSLIKQIKIGV